MIVARDDLEAGLARLRAETGDPNGGLFGPDSISWRLNGEVANFLGAGRAALLQLAHPYVAHAIDQHSRTREDALGRFRGTFANVFAMAFGDLDQALRAARRVHAIHTRVRGVIDEDVGRFSRGSSYAANESSALLWVHATLIDTVLRVHDLVGRRGDADERVRYYAESRRFAGLFGIPDEELPRDRSEFAAYMDGMVRSDVLAVGRPALEIAGFLFQPPHPALAPVAGWYRVMTAGLLPPRLRRGFQLRFGPAQRAMFAASVRGLRLVRRSAPAPMRMLPAYLEARRRTGVAATGAVGRAVEGAVIRSAELGIWPKLAR